MPRGRKPSLIHIVGPPGIRIILSTLFLVSFFGIAEHGKGVVGTLFFIFIFDF